MDNLQSRCRCPGVLLPVELMRAQQYNTTIHLSWSHYLSQRGRAVPTTFEAESSVRLRMLRSTQCLIMHAHGLNFTEVSVARAPTAAGCNHGQPASVACTVVTHLSCVVYVMCTYQSQQVCSEHEKARTCRCTSRSTITSRSACAVAGTAAPEPPAQVSSSPPSEWAGLAASMLVDHLLHTCCNAYQACCCCCALG